MLHLDSYPKLTPVLLDSIGFMEKTLLLSYIEDGTTYNLEFKESEDGIVIDDPRLLWDLGMHNLDIAYSFSIDRIAPLFEEHGIAGSSDELGIALIWIDKASQVRGSLDVGEVDIRSTNADLSLSVNLHMKRNMLREKLDVALVLYMKRPDVNKDSSRRTCKITGAILGVLRSFSFLIEDEGSIFPIVKVSEKGKALWWLTYDFSDPHAPFNSDTFCVYINELHPDYPVLYDEKKPREVTPLMREMMASVMTILIEKGLEAVDPSDLKSSVMNVPIGSIAHLMNYYVNNQDISAGDNVSELARKVREYLNV